MVRWLTIRVVGSTLVYRFNPGYGLTMRLMHPAEFTAYRGRPWEDCQ